MTEDVLDQMRLSLQYPESTTSRYTIDQIIVYPSWRDAACARCAGRNANRLVEIGFRYRRGADWVRWGARILCARCTDIIACAATGRVQWLSL